MPPFALLVMLLSANAAPASGPARQQAPSAATRQEASPVKIRLQLEDRTLTATLEESEAAREFLSLLPLTLMLADYNSTEKIADLPRRLSTKGAPEGIDPDVGDLAYYAPWGNLAIFYRDFGYSKGLVRLGRLVSGVEALSGRGPLRVTIERAGP